jgi:hypothetical protein
MYATYVTIIGHDDNFDPIGEAHVAYDTTGKFTYGETANTDLGGAYSYKGGKWDISVGTNHMGNTKTEVIADYTAHQAYVGTTKFRYRKERLDFTDDWGDGHVCRTDYRIVPEGWLGGWLDGADVSSKDSGGQMDTARGKGWALKFRAKTHWTKDTSRGHKYHTDVSAFGVGLHATSTWSSDVQFHWDFGGATDEHWLYGSNGTIKDAENVYAW